VRVDSWVEEGSVVSSDYDPLLAKLCVWGENRDRALARLRRALREYRIEGVTTNLQLLQHISAEADFVAGDYSTSYLEDHPELCRRAPSPEQLVALAVGSLETRPSEQERFSPCALPAWAREQD
jgi:3-methylcrotonyl-CoA carboxylase alpha subunit